MVVSGTLILNFMAGGRADFVLRASMVVVVVVVKEELGGRRVWSVWSRCPADFSDDDS